MAFVSKKRINGKERYYLEKSVRFPSGKVKKFSLYLKGYPPNKTDMVLFKQQLGKKIEEALVQEAIQQFKTSLIFTKEEIAKVEKMKLGYQKIVRQLTDKQNDDVLDRFAVNFTYESNALEGNSLTLKDVTFIIQEGKVLPGKDLREVFETLNTRKALAWVQKRLPKINKESVIKLHDLLVYDTGVATGYKRLPNFLLGRTVQTTPPEHVEAEMEKLFKEYQHNQRLHPLQRAALFHGHFEQIHPFEDGNGRVGRLLINIILQQHGYPPLIIRKTQRVKYFHALEAFDHGHPDKLYRFLLEKYKDTYSKFFEVYVKYLF